MKLDINDKLFSQFKRQHQTVCQRCEKPLKLNCCHIFSRRYYSTRFEPLNAIVLCFPCHTWFDTHKITACLFDEGKRVFTDKDESFHFLVSRLGYSWEDLVELYLKSQEPFRGYKTLKKDISKHLKSLLKDE